MKLADITKLIISCLLCLSAGALGSLFTTTDSLTTWYAALTKPSFTPPGWLFGPVWTVLYILMGLSFFLIWRKGLHTRPAAVALACFITQLILNALWTPIFFCLHLILLAFIEILLLSATILITILAFARISPAAAILLIPYLAWTAFAAVLNASIYLLNK
ncbi:MAG: tryptophan-rich sensory protein [Planctomycetota bacterium]|nr:MAG: tryptophan-rich sensory protein [Planctomycetota bacterium]